MDAYDDDDEPFTLRSSGKLYAGWDEARIDDFESAIWNWIDRHLDDVDELDIDQSKVFKFSSQSGRIYRVRLQRRTPGVRGPQRVLEVKSVEFLGDEGPWSSFPDRG